MHFLRRGLQENLGPSGMQSRAVALQRYGPQIKSVSGTCFHERQPLSVRREGPRNLTVPALSQGCGLPDPSERVTGIPSPIAKNAMYRPSGLHTSWLAFPVKVNCVIVSRCQS